MILQDYSDMEATWAVSSENTHATRAKTWFGLAMLNTGLAMLAWFLCYKLMNCFQKYSVSRHATMAECKLISEDNLSCKSFVNMNKPKNNSQGRWCCGDFLNQI